MAIKKSTVYKNIFLVTVIAAILLYIVNFLVYPAALAKDIPMYEAAVWLIIGYSIAMALLLLLVKFLLKKQKLTFKDIGLRKPSKMWAMIVGIAFALLMVWFNSYNMARFEINMFEFTVSRIGIALLGLFIGASEEILMRGFVMDQLNRIKVKPWIQVVSSGLLWAFYHSIIMIGFSNPFMIISAFVFSVIMGCFWAWLYLFNKRSLGAPMWSHGIINLLAEPYMLMVLIASILAFA